MARPRKYDDPNELKEVIDKYFKSLNGEGDIPDKVPTVAGLTRALGFDSRQSLFDYSKNDTFSYLIKDARLAIEEWHESRLSGTVATGSIFWLKNHAGYTDKHEQTVTGGDTPVGIALKIEYVN